jgi:hypothetical protein
VVIVAVGTFEGRGVVQRDTPADVFRRITSAASSVGFAAGRRPCQPGARQPRLRPGRRG